MNTKNITTWLLLALVLVLPSLWGIAMVILDNDTSRLGNGTPTEGYFSCLILGGIFGGIGCFKLSEPRGKFRVLLGATLFIFVSETLRGFSIMMDTLLDTPGELGVMTTFLFHSSGFLVFAFGLLIFVGSTAWGKRKGLLVKRIGYLIAGATVIISIVVAASNLLT